MNNKGILISLGVLIALVLFLVFTDRDDEMTSSEPDLTPAFTTFLELDLSKVSRFTVEKGEEGENRKSADVVKKDGGWVLASSYDYPASAEKIERFFDELKKVEASDYPRAERRESHRDFEVDPVRGTKVTLYDGGGSVMGTIHLGKHARSALIDVTNSYVRFDDDDRVYQVGGSARGNVGGSGEELEPDYLLDDKLFELPEGTEISEARILRPGDGQNVFLERRWIEKPAGEIEDTEEPAEGDESAAEPKEPEREEQFFVASGEESFQPDDSKKWEVRSYLNNRTSLRIKSAADPTEDLATYGLDAPHLKVELYYAQKDAKDAKDAEPQQVTVLFGNAIKDEETGEDKSYYVTLGGAASPRRIYTVEKWTYDSWAKELADFKPEPEEPAEEEQEADAAEAAGETDAAEAEGDGDAEAEADAEADAETAEAEAEAAEGDADADDAGPEDATTGESTPDDADAGAAEPLGEGATRSGSGS